MIIRSIINKIEEDLRKEFPSLTPEENRIAAMKVYGEYQRILLYGDGGASPIREYGDSYPSKKALE